MKREIIRVASAQPERTDSIEPVSRGRRVMQQLAEWHILIQGSHKFHSTVELATLTSRRHARPRLPGWHPAVAWHV